MFDRAQETLKLATGIPLEIAEQCMKLVDFAAYVFDNGFKAARGDSGVALNSAISGVVSCLSAAELNLISLVKAIDGKGNVFIVEVQIAEFEVFRKRILYYTFQS